MSCMRKSNGQSQEAEDMLVCGEAHGAYLDLPIDRDFAPRPPRIDPKLMFARCEEMLPFRRRKPDFEQKRLTGRCTEEFVL